MSEPTLLDALLHIVDRATDDFDRPATLWFATADPTADPDGITLGCKEVDGHPLPHLLGFVAPPDWTVFGVTSCGWAAGMDGGCRPSQHPDRRRVRQTVLVGRSGATAGAIHFADGAEPFTEPPTEGVVLDAMLRCLELPTAPPAESTRSLFTSWWLGDVIGAGRAAGRRLTWSEVADLHPGVRMLAADGDDGLVPPSDLVRIATALSNVVTWERLRDLAAGGGYPSIVDAEVAAWMDDGMLSRWLLGDLDPVEALLAEADHHLSRSCARRLESVVDQLRTIRAA